jgi:hypothetical protein
MDDISNPQTSKDNTKRKKRCAWFRLWMLSNTNPDSVMKWGKERRRNNQDEKTGIGTGTCVRLCDVQWFPISLCYTLYYPSFDSPFFSLNYYYWRLLFWSLCNFPLFLYVHFFPLFCLFWVNLVWQWCRWFASNVKAQYSLLMSFRVFKTSLSSAMIGEAWMSNVKFLFHIFHLIF